MRVRKLQFHLMPCLKSLFENNLIFLLFSNLRSIDVDNNYKAGFPSIELLFM